MATAVKVIPTNDPELFDETDLPSRRFWSLRRIILAAAILVAIASGLSWWLYARQFETTDDAQVDGHFAQLSTRVTGTVLYVNPQVENNHYVKAGTILMRLDPRDYEADLDHARAILDTKEAEAHSAGIQVSITQATALSRLHVAEAQEKAAVEIVAEAEAARDAARRRVQQDTAIAAHAERDRRRSGFSRLGSVLVRQRTCSGSGRRDDNQRVTGVPRKRIHVGSKSSSVLMAMEVFSVR